MKLMVLTRSLEAYSTKTIKESHHAIYTIDSHFMKMLREVLEWSEFSLAV